MNAFTAGNLYSRKDIYKIMNVPKNKQAGIWNIGYVKYNDDILFLLILMHRGVQVIIIIIDLLMMNYSGLVKETFH